MFDLTIEKDVELNQIGRRSKNRKIYDQIERALPGEWIVIGAETMNRANSIAGSIRVKYPDVQEVHVRKYTGRGLHGPTVYVRK